MNLAQASALCGLKGENAKTARISASILSGKVRRAVMVQMDDAGVLVAENGVINIMDTSTGCKIVDYSGATSFFTGVLAAELVKKQVYSRSRYQGPSGRSPVHGEGRRL